MAKVAVTDLEKLDKAADGVVGEPAYTWCLSTGSSRAEPVRWSFVARVDA